MKVAYDGTVTGTGPWLYTFTNATSEAWIYFNNSASSPLNDNWRGVFNVLERPTAGGSTAVAPAVTYAVNLDPEDGGSCTVASVSGSAGSWQRLPQLEACTKPGFRFVGWEARHTDGQPATMYGAYSFINLTGDNTLYAMWAPVDVPVIEPVRSTRWVVWRWDAAANRMRPVSADLVGLSPVVTIHAPQASSVSDAMVKAAKALAVANGGTYDGIVTSTEWSKPRMVTAYRR